MTICPFCGHDPYHYVDNGVGMEAVAVTCCELGCALFDHRNGQKPVELSWEEFTEVANTLGEKRRNIQELEDFLVENDLWDKFLDTSALPPSHGEAGDK
jgi:hypothetical protein